jgi:hypothetical protein
LILESRAARSTFEDELRIAAAVSGRRQSQHPRRRPSSTMS